MNSVIPWLTVKIERQPAHLTLFPLACEGGDGAGARSGGASGGGTDGCPIMLFVYTFSSSTTTYLWTMNNCNGFSMGENWTGRRKLKERDSGDFSDKRAPNAIGICWRSFYCVTAFFFFLTF